MNEALVLGLVFAVLLLAGVPISFAIGSAAVAALLMSLDPAAATTVIAQRMATGLDSFEQVGTDAACRAVSLDAGPG